MFQFVAVLDINISHYYTAAHLRCGGMFYYGFAGNFLLKMLPKENWLHLPQLFEKYSDTFFWK